MKIAAASSWMFAIAFLLSASAGMGQTIGPRNPGTTGNNSGVGATNWASTGNSISSDNNYSTVSTKGITRYLTTTNYGFAIPTPSGIAGIQLEVERSTNAPTAVALLNGWSTGTTKTISAGTDRCLIVTYVQENGINTRDITAMTYGGRAMTQIAEQTAGTTGGFSARLEVWMLLEADLSLASSTAIVPTFGSYTALEYCEAFSSAVFQNVDQTQPVGSAISTGASNPPSSANPHQLGTPITTLAGSMAINVVTEGNNTTPAITNGGTNTYTINSGYTEGTDLYFANTSVAPTSGACFQTAHKAIASNGTEQPSCTFNGSVNRWAMIAFTLQRSNEFDHRVQLIKGGVIGGLDLSNTSPWPTTDTYATYGGPLELWGRSWTTADINASNFGAALAAKVANGTARVDHMRVTVYYYSTLPVELLYFHAEADGPSVRLEWATATERENDHFIVQRSSDGFVFEDVARIPGAGDSNVARFYSIHDPRPNMGISYYRLVQVDNDGTTDESAMVPVDMMSAELFIYPNPAEEVLTIRDPEARAVEVGVYDGSMRLVRSANIRSEEPILLLSGLPDGTYTLLLRAGDDTQVSRLVKVSRSN